MKYYVLKDDMSQNLPKHIGEKQRIKNGKENKRKRKKIEK